MPALPGLSQEDWENSQPVWDYRDIQKKQQQQSDPYLMAKMYLIFEVSLSQETILFYT